jgi:hypothetical protein
MPSNNNSKLQGWESRTADRRPIAWKLTTVAAEGQQKWRKEANAVGAL